jgi:hypothetical protein
VVKPGVGAGVKVAETGLGLMEGVGGYAGEGGGGVGVRVGVGVAGVNVAWIAGVDALPQETSKIKINITAKPRRIAIL